MADIISYVTIAGTSYRYKKSEPSSGETWVLNDSGSIPVAKLFTATFVSNGQTFDKMRRWRR